MTTYRSALFCLILSFSSAYLFSSMIFILQKQEQCECHRMAHKIRDMQFNLGTDWTQTQPIRMTGGRHSTQLLTFVLWSYVHTSESATQIKDTTFSSSKHTSLRHVVFPSRSPTCLQTILPTLCKDSD
jgi:hypothetical protein